MMSDVAVWRVSVRRGRLIGQCGLDGGTDDPACSDIHVGFKDHEYLNELESRER